MPETARRDIAALLRELRKHTVDFIVVGGVAAVLEGAPIDTFDLDMVHSREPHNITRLLAALESLQAHCRSRPELTPQASHLSSGGRQLLMTRFGPLDILGSIGHGHAYDDLLAHTTEVDAAPDLRINVLSLEMVIAIKEEVADQKDLAVLPVLRRTLEEKRRLRK